MEGRAQVVVSLMNQLVTGYTYPYFGNVLIYQLIIAVEGICILWYPRPYEPSISYRRYLRRR